MKLIDIKEKLPRDEQHVIIATNEEDTQFFPCYYSAEYNCFCSLDPEDNGWELEEVKGWADFNELCLSIKDDVPVHPVYKKPTPTIERPKLKEGQLGGWFEHDAQEVDMKNVVFSNEYINKI